MKNEVKISILCAYFQMLVLQVKLMSSLYFWFVYYTRDNVYTVKTVFIVVLDRTTGQHKFWATCLNELLVN